MYFWETILTAPKFQIVNNYIHVQCQYYVITVITNFGEFRAVDLDRQDRYNYIQNFDRSIIPEAQT